MHPGPGVRRALIAAYAVYLACVVWLVWSPSPSAPSSAVAHVVEAARRLGIALTPTFAEFSLNVVMLVPLSLIGGLIFTKLRIADWTMIGFVASFTIEVVQRLLIPTRTGSTRDIVSNTLGALLGAVLLTVACHALSGWAAKRRTVEKSLPAGESSAQGLT